MMKRRLLLGMVSFSACQCLSMWEGGSDGSLMMKAEAGQGVMMSSLRRLFLGGGFSVCLQP